MISRRLHLCLLRNAKQDKLDETISTILMEDIEIKINTDENAIVIAEWIAVKGQWWEATASATGTYVFVHGPLVISSKGLQDSTVHC